MSISMEAGVGQLLTDVERARWPKVDCRSAFAVGDGYVLTAWHCIDHIGGAQARVWLRLRPLTEGVEFTDVPVRYKDHDTVHDAAVLMFDSKRAGASGWKLRELLDSVALPLSANVGVYNDGRIIGFPVENPARFATPHRGHVVSTDATLGTGRIIRLDVPATRAVFPDSPSGMSGGPLVVEHRDGVERVVGIVSVFPPADEDGRYALGGTVVCRHIEDVIETLEARIEIESPTDEYPTFVDRKDKFKELTTALRSGHAIVGVIGSSGVGKSKLVRKVLGRFTNTLFHDLSWATSLDAKTLIDDLTQGDEPARNIRRSETLYTRLRVVLEGHRGPEIVVVIDPAENLLDDHYRVQDPNLDEALETISTVGGDSIKVVLVSQFPPQSRNSANTWPSSMWPVDIKGLEPTFFGDLIGDVSPGPDGLAELWQQDESMVYAKLRGNPRLAMLLTQIVELAIVPRQRVHTWLARISKDIPRRLADELVLGLPLHQQRAVRALAAFGIPVDETLAAELLEENPEHIKTTLDHLAKKHVIHTASEQRYYVLSGEIERILDLLFDSEEQKVVQLRKTVRLLKRRQPLISTATGPEDFELHFAELAILLRARLYRRAHELIEAMDDVLGQWNPSALLFAQRERIKDKIGEAFDEMRNYNALGDLYVSRGRFADAHTAYNHALRYQQICGATESKRRIDTNIAALHWERNETDAAASHYRSALAAAMQEQPDDKTQILAREGLADCHRRWGEYADAIAQAERAFTVASQARSTRAVHIAVKLARWHAELGHPEAEQWLEHAEEEAAEWDIESLRAICLDARADLLLDASALDSVLATTKQAVTAALVQCDPVILLQARTTRCFAYLLKRDIDNARREIERAATLRRKERSLLVLALQALVALEDADRGMAKSKFDELSTEAVERRSRDEQDFAAWDFEGIALCARTGDDSLGKAREAFTEARRKKLQPTPGLDSRLAYIVDRIGLLTHRSDQFRRVLTVLGPPIGSSGG